MGDKERALLPISKCADSQAVSEAGRMVPILTQLLSTATEAQGDFPPDPSKAKMSSEVQVKSRKQSSTTIFIFFRMVSRLGIKIKILGMKYIY